MSSTPHPTRPSPDAPPAQPEPLQPVAGLLGLLLPGLGHLYLGHVRRALAVFVGVFGLFVSGLFIGGIDCVDRRDDFIWFLGQGLVGPAAFAVDHVHQTRFKVIDPRRVVRDPATGHDMPLLRSASPTEFRNPENGTPVPIAVAADGSSSASYVSRSGQRVTVSPAYPPLSKGLGRMNELGTLFTTLAGFLNLIVVFDALWHHRRPWRSPARAAPAGPRTLRVPGGVS